MYKKIFGLFFSMIFLVNIININATAQSYTFEELLKMTDYEYYSIFAKALKEHDSQTLADIVPHTGDKSQFDHLENVTIKSYSVEANKNSFGGSAKITLNITKSSDALFPVGKQEYYAYYQTGIYELFEFGPYDKKDYKLSQKYRYLAMTFGYMSFYMNDFGSSTAKQIKNYEYSADLVHWIYHLIFQEAEDSYGISINELNKDLQTLFDSQKTLSNETAKELKKYCYENDKYFYRCNHGSNIDLTYSVKKITKNKKTGLYTMDIWYYSDAAKLNPSKKIKYTYKNNNGVYTLKRINCYYDSGYDVFKGV